MVIGFLFLEMKKKGNVIYYYLYIINMLNVCIIEL